MAIEWRGPVPESNYTVGRDGNAITLIVDHWTVVMFEAAVRRFLNPESILSAHYVIGQDGRITQLVSEDDTAYHAGVYAVNLRSIGIEHEAGPAMAPTDALYTASARLHAEIASRHRLAPGGDDRPAASRHRPNGVSRDSRSRSHRPRSSASTGGGRHVHRR